MKKIILALIVFFSVVSPVIAQAPSPDVDLEAAEATDSATGSGIVEKVVEKKPDLTEPQGEVKSKLERLLEENPVERLSWNNPLRFVVYQAVRNGVPVNTIVLVLLFPLIAAIVVASRHLIGLRGLGILTPSLLAVSFIATGISVGVVLFLAIFVVATFARMLLRRLKLQYLPRMALLLWFVSFGVFAVLAISSYFNYSGLVTVGIFPILILMLLAETFIDVQVGRSFRDAMTVMLSTFVLAIVSSYIVGLDYVQRTVLLYPELIYFGVGLFDVFMAKYVGLRFVEYLKFSPIMNSSDDEE